MIWGCGSYSLPREVILFPLAWTSLFSLIISCLILFVNSPCYLPCLPAPPGHVRDTQWSRGESLINRWALHRLGVEGDNCSDLQNQANSRCLQRTLNSDWLLLSLPPPPSFHPELQNCIFLGFSPCQTPSPFLTAHNVDLVYPHIRYTYTSWLCLFFVSCVWK